MQRNSVHTELHGLVRLLYWLWQHQTKLSWLTFILQYVAHTIHCFTISQKSLQSCYIPDPGMFLISTYYTWSYNKFVNVTCWPRLKNTVPSFPFKVADRDSNSINTLKEHANLKNKDALVFSFMCGEGCLNKIITFQANIWNFVKSNKWYRHSTSRELTESERQELSMQSSARFHHAA